MSVSFLGLIVIAIGIWSQFGAYQRVVIAMMALCVFGAVGALELPALGGASITPADLFILFLGLRLVSMRQGTTLLLAEIGPRRPLFLFALLSLWICGLAFIGPRLFDGATYVFSLSRTIDVDGAVPLHPTSGNISQLVYALGGFALTCATAAFARRPGGYEAFLSGLFLVTGLDIVFALLDMVTSATHTGFVLDLIHTANYAFLTADDIGGVKRISGSFTEASSFASFSLLLLGVNFPLFVMRIRPRVTGAASAALTALIILSTSSSGYVGLGVFYGTFMAYVIVTVLVTLRKRPATIALALACGGILLCSAVMLFLPSVAATAQMLFTESVLNKSASDSAIERSSWNEQGWRVFLDTYGIGAGIGSTRTSSYVMLLLSNLGAVGLALFAALMIWVLLGRLDDGLDEDGRALVRAARIGTAIALFTSTLVGTVFYLGALFYVILGIAASGVSEAGARRALARRGLVAGSSIPQRS